MLGFCSFGSVVGVQQGRNLGISVSLYFSLSLLFSDFSTMRLVMFLMGVGMRNIYKKNNKKGSYSGGVPHHFIFK